MTNFVSKKLTLKPRLHPDEIVRPSSKLFNPVALPGVFKNKGAVSGNVVEDGGWWLWVGETGGREFGGLCPVGGAAAAAAAVAAVSATAPWRDGFEGWDNTRSVITPGSARRDLIRGCTL